MIKQIIRRANVKSIYQYILYGDELLTSDVDIEDNFELFIDPMCKQFEDALKEKLHYQKLEEEITKTTLPIIKFP